MCRNSSYLDLNYPMAILAPSASGGPVSPENQSNMELGESCALQGPTPSSQVPQFPISGFPAAPAKASKQPWKVVNKKGLSI